MQSYLNETQNTSKQLSAIKVDGVSVQIENNIILDNISLDIKKGSFVYVVGANGSGKSTLMKVLMGAILPSSGTLQVFSDAIGYLPQNHNIYPSFPITVEEVIYSGYKEQKLKISDERKKEIKFWLEKMNIEHLYQRLMSSLSGGQQQRVLFIRALINHPEILILDEPTSALDIEFKKVFYKIVDELHEQGTTILFVTHDVHGRKMRNEQVMHIDKQLKFFGKVDDYHSANIQLEEM